MSQFIRILTAVAIFVHSLGGCCAHEAHGVASHFLEQMDSPVVDSCRFDQHKLVRHDHKVVFEHVQSRGEEGCHHGHTPLKPEPHSCYHESCQWPAPEVRHTTEFMFTSYWANPGVYSELPLALTHSDSVNLTDFLSQHFQSLPVRSHLAIGVFLI